MPAPTPEPAASDSGGARGPGEAGARGSGEGGARGRGEDEPQAAAPRADELRRALAQLPTGVTVVSAIADEGPSGATVNAVTSLSLEPPLMLACLDRGSRTLVAVSGSRRFSINVLSAEQADLARRFSSKAHRSIKWDGVEWACRSGTPRIAGCVLWLGLTLRDLHDGGDHVIATGEVVDLERGGGSPLIFHRGGYRELVESPALEP